MPLDSQVEILLAEMATVPATPIHELTPVEAREQMVAASNMLGDPAAVDSIEDRIIIGPHGEIPLRVYRPADALGGAVVYFHGGGWVVGSITTHDGYCRMLANTGNRMVVSVDYRLAPEHQFPTAAEDAFEATRWVSESLPELGGSAGPLVVAGDSAGGNLAAVVALMARDQGGPAIELQVLIYPITDYNLQTLSYQDFADGFFLTRDAMAWFWDQYCPQAERRHDPYISPLRCDDLKGLPRALVMTAEFDPLRDEGERYAEKLQAAKVPVKLSRYDGMIHGFVRRINRLDKASNALTEVAKALRTTQLW